MKTKQILLLAGFLFTMMIFSCIKDTIKPLGDAGKTILKFNDGPQKSLFFSPFTDIKKINVFNFRRDPNSTAELTKSATILLKLDPTVIEKFNTDHNESFELLPPSFYTFDNDPGIAINGDQFTFNFLSGEFAKNMNIKVDGTQWTDLSKKYALAFVVTNTDGYQLSASKDTMITFFSIKNKYDGVYEVQGNMVDLLGTRFGRYPKTVELRTTNTNEVIVVDMKEDKVNPVWYYQNAAGDLKAAFGLGFTFDLTTNQITSAFDADGDGFTLELLDPQSENKYDPNTGTITVVWKTGANSSGFPLGRFTVTETYTYKGPRE